MEKKIKDRKLPIYTLVLKDDTEDSGVNYVALVDEPAIERNWFAFGGPGSGPHPNGGGDTDSNEELATNIENSIASNPNESGHILIDGKEIKGFTGSGRQININTSEFEKSVVGMDRSKMSFTHNHPAVIDGYGGSFSSDDIVAMAYMQVGEFRAVDEHYVYSIKRKGDKIGRQDLGKMKSHLTRESTKMVNKYRSETNSNDELKLKVYSEGQHEVIQSFTNKFSEYGFTYTRKNRNKR